MKQLILFLALASCGAACDVAGQLSNDGRNTLPHAASSPALEPITSDYSPPAAVRAWYYNPGNIYREHGSCVQCSIGMAGVKANNLPAAMLIWDTPYGEAVIGGASPSRVASYCAERGISIFNVTGSATLPFAKWVCDTGRAAAITFGTQHVQTLMGHDGERWLVCDNNTPKRVDKYTDEEYRRLHALAGQWIVVLDGPAPPPPALEMVPHKKKGAFAWLRG